MTGGTMTWTAQHDDRHRHIGIGPSGYWVDVGVKVSYSKKG